MALSTTASGVLILPQSCSQAAARNSRQSVSSVKWNSPSGPLSQASAASASISASSGTREQ